jgi:hypothetical protein
MARERPTGHGRSLSGTRHLAGRRQHQAEARASLPALSRSSALARAWRSCANSPSVIDSRLRLPVAQHGELDDGAGRHRADLPGEIAGVSLCLPVRSGTIWPGTWRLRRYTMLSARLQFRKVANGAARHWARDKSFSTRMGTETTLGLPQAVDTRIAPDMNGMVVVNRLLTTATARPAQSSTGAPEEP